MVKVLQDSIKYAVSYNYFSTILISGMFLLRLYYAYKEE